MIDGHIHIERGEYTLDWINQFVDRAVEMQIDEIWLLEHCALTQFRLVWMKNCLEY